ncbi:hypothetical protein ACNAUY_08285 [Acinetobacter tibetensis]|uniref:hypothetical protein n=1 Tax=Acinetobacter tibetensis TaxID=2943497 RepID=UPI003A4E5414
MFTPEELAKIKAEAKAEAAETVKKHFVEKALADIGITTAEQAAEHFAGKHEAVDGGFEVVTPLPTADDEFRETDVYGLNVRVNRSGTKVELKVNERWEERLLQHTGSAKHSKFVVLPNSLCRQSSAKCGTVSCRVSHLVMKAFSVMPEYMTDVYFTAKGPTIMFGLDLVEHLDGLRSNAHLDNLKWASKQKFIQACAKRAARLGIPLPV